MQSQPYVFTEKLLRVAKRATISSKSQRSLAFIPYLLQSADQHVPAIPFAFSKEAAIRHVGVAASAGCLFRDFLGSLGAKYIGGNFQPIQPIRIQPVYFPAWFLDAEVESYLNDEDHERQVYSVTCSLATFIYVEPCSEWSPRILITGTLAHFSSLFTADNFRNSYLPGAISLHQAYQRG